MVSPTSNFCWEEMKSLLLPRSSTSTVAVALDVEPVIVSFATNLPVVPVPVSVLIFTGTSPSDKIKLVETVSCRILSIVTVTINSAASKN